MEEELTGDGMAKSPSNTDTISQCTHRLQYRNLKIAVIGLIVLSYFRTKVFLGHWMLSLQVYFPNQLVKTS